MIRRVYQLAAAGCAEVVSRVPAFEEPFVQLGGRAWSLPWFGRFYRSMADRVAQRIGRTGSRFRRIMVGETPLVLDITEFTTRPLYFGRVQYEPRTAECLHQRLKHGGVFVDIGANHGYFSMLAAALVGPGGRVAAFEPNPDVFAQLEAHIRLNGFEDRVVPVRAALGAAPSAAAPLFISQNTNNSGLSSLTPARSTVDLGWLSPSHTIEVPVETFDRWFASSGLGKVDLVKIDVEGAEEAVITGMSASLDSGRLAAILCETVWGGPAHMALRAAGYGAQLLEEMGPLSNVLYVLHELDSPNILHRR